MGAKTCRILALDCAIRTSGYAVFENNELKTFSHFSTLNNSIEDRIEEVRKNVSFLLEQGIDYVILEDIQLQRNVSTFKALAKLQGVLENMFIRKNIKYLLVHNASWRKEVGVKGRKSKEQKENAQNIVREIFDIEVTEDEADAILIGLYLCKKGVDDDTESILQ